MEACSLVLPFGSSFVLGLALLQGCGGGESAGKPPEAPTAASAPTEAPEDAPAEAPKDAPAASDTSKGGGAEEPSAAEKPKAGGADSRSMESITAVVKEHRKEARECYEKALKTIPGLKGDLVIRFIVKPNGTVKHAELNEPRSTIRNETVTGCVIDVIMKLPFPKSSKGFESEVNYPFNFNP